MIAIPIMPTRVGPFVVERHQMSDGWIRYTLVIDGKSLRTWSSLPSLNDCRECVFSLQEKGKASTRTVSLLLRSEDAASIELAQLRKRNRN